MAKKAEIVLRRAHRYLRLQVQIKALYKKSDELFERIRKDLPPGKQVGNVILVDNFVDTNKVYRAHGISRFELKVIGE